MNATPILTLEERQTIDAAIEIIASRTPEKASWMLSIHNYYGDPGSGVTFFDTRNEQHSEHAGKRVGFGSVADRVEAALVIQRDVEADADGYRARRLEALKREIAALEQAA